MKKLEKTPDVLAAFKNAVQRSFPGQVESIVLFGSRARGDASSGSDWDVAVFLKGQIDRDAVGSKLIEITYPAFLDGDNINALAFSEDDLGQISELMYDIKTEGLVV